MLKWKFHLLVCAENFSYATNPWGCNSDKKNLQTDPFLGILMQIISAANCLAKAK